jgi:hypothetical protein
MLPRVAQRCQLPEACQLTAVHQAWQQRPLLHCLPLSLLLHPLWHPRHPQHYPRPACCYPWGWHWLLSWPALRQLNWHCLQGHLPLLLPSCQRLPTVRQLLRLPDCRLGCSSRRCWVT